MVEEKERYTIEEALPARATTTDNRRETRFDQETHNSRNSGEESNKKNREKKRKRRQREVTSKNLSAMDDEVRKAKQRAKQQEALRRQREGGLTKKEIKRRRAAGEELPPLPKKKAKKKVHERERWKQSDEAAAGTDGIAGESRPNHDIVIIPIFWRNVPGQEDAIVQEALRIKGILHSVAKLDVWVDRTHKRTPGQKLKFWEEQGVRWRVEVGPKDASKQRCVVSYQAGRAGDFSTVTKVPNVSTVKRLQLLSKLRDTLNLTKIPEDAIARVKDDADGDRNEKEKAIEIMRTLGDGSEESQGAGTDGDSSDRKAAHSERVDSNEPLNAKERRILRRKHLQQDQN